MSDGSPNDLLLERVIGPGWKDLTGCDKPVVGTAYSEYLKVPDLWDENKGALLNGKSSNEKSLNKKGWIICNVH